VAAAALIYHGGEMPEYRRAVAVLSGGNVDPALLAGVLTESGV
jgi:threonine dehydratase